MQPLDLNQQELINVVKLTHTNLAVARKTRNAEVTRRVALEQERIRIEAQRLSDEAAERIRIELDHEVALHEGALDDALIAAYNAGIPIRRIALDGFGNRYPGGVQQLIVKLRNEGLVGSSEDYQRNTTPELDTPRVVEFPQPIDVIGILNDALTVAEPSFQFDGELTLVENDPDGLNGIFVPSVVLMFDARDPWFKQIEKNARPGTPYLRATTATLYLHPATGELAVHESKEEGETYWDHPVARWVKDHPFEAKDGFLAAINAAQ